jgi:hypothetical protein
MPSEQVLHNYFGQDAYILNGVQQAFNVPKSLHKSLSKAFHSNSGKKILRQIRAYNKPALDKKDIRTVQKAIRKSPFNEVFMSNYAVIGDRTNHRIFLPLRGISERKSPDQIFNPITFEQQMISSIPAWLQMKRVIEQNKLDVTIPNNVYAWYYGKYLRPSKEAVQLSDRDYLVAYTPICQLDLRTEQGQDKRKQLLRQLSPKQIHTLEVLVDKGGLWSMSAVNFDGKGHLVINQFQQPDNTISAPNMGLPGVFYGNSATKKAWNRYAGFKDLSAVLPAGEDKERIADQAKHEFATYERTKAIEQKELQEAHQDIKKAVQALN